jgi:hypothetical protein
MTLSEQIVKDIYWADDSYRRVLTLVMLFPNAAYDRLEEMTTLGEGESVRGLIAQLRRKRIIDSSTLSIGEEYKQSLERLFTETYKSPPTASFARELERLFSEDGTLSQQSVELFESMAGEKPAPQPFFGQPKPYYVLRTPRLCLFPLDKAPNEALIGSQAVLVAARQSGNIREQEFLPILIAPRIPAQMVSMAIALNVDLYLLDAFSLLQLKGLVNSVTVDTLRQMGSRLRHAFLDQPVAGLWNVSAAWLFMSLLPSEEAS